MSNKKQLNKHKNINDEEIGNTIVKKQITETSSNDKTAITKINGATQQSLKDVTNLKKDQEQIMMNIENINIQNYVQEKLQKFNPPKCFNCDNRTADRVCVNKTCSKNSFMKLICGKCHSKEHQDQINKPEIDLEEFFIKLATFLNEQKYKKQKSDSVVNDSSDGLSKFLDDINKLRYTLNELREQLKIEVDDYQRPEEIQNNVSNSITKTLSQFQHENIQDQLNYIKKFVFFNGNSFTWNDCQQKQNNMNSLIQTLENKRMDISLSIKKSLYAQGQSINLSDIKVIKSNIPGYGDSNILSKLIDNELFITNETVLGQAYLDYKFVKEYKYKIRFRLEFQPSYYAAVGITSLSKANQWVYNFESHFCKIFNSPSPSLDCSRVLKGQDNRYLFNRGDQFEMRIDFQNYYMDIYDYPEMKNINANLLDNKILLDESFVLAISLHRSQCIVIESIIQVNEIIDYQ